jgi:tRNA pseudouridine38-40 synthase
VTSLTPAVLSRQLNDELPADINILSAAQVPHRFHARHDAVSRRYLYQIARRRTAFAKAYVWWVKEPIATSRMRDAASRFVGMRDFRSFAHSDGADERPKSTLVLVERVDIAEEGDLILVGIEGSHFLWKMVRRMVGVLVHVGRGAIGPSAAAECLTSRSELPATLTAPPSGLFLERVLYPGDAGAPGLTAMTPLNASAPSIPKAGD